MDRDSGANGMMRRQRIEMFYLADGQDDRRYPIVREDSPRPLIRIYNALARQYRRETCFDVAPYIAESRRERFNDGPEQAAVLIPAEGIDMARARVIAGVVGLERSQRSRFCF